MKIEVLGCSGGIGPTHYTTCLRINESILIDAGSGLSNLLPEQYTSIKNIFLTHSHLDHICCLPMFLDGLLDYHTPPIQIHGLPETLNSLKQHIFNWQIWPDFSVIPSQQKPLMRYQALQLGDRYEIDNLFITPVLAKHTVDACGYLLEEKGKRVLFTGDTLYDQHYIDMLNSNLPLDLLIIECAFPNSMDDIATQAGHLTPKTLHQLIAQLSLPPKEVRISHIKPSASKIILSELKAQKHESEFRILETHEKISL
ncbi:3',5'-cyclic-nucleotide phosphodiesterase [Nitrincola tapanii]|uniref:3',5'-cyclic-nucleotide phosphodiesterase n=1 Tax=Nitrincola tapanii TaxID=1708751 RepID=A0A5A9WA35_9GAMM|nr:3',5'-cyclic-nucleotide phosphodiesterase [Nitrincola tapanii]KAA0876281.1 3',5'-cyclic-nucleotide phosphodiesterase [Nitrincola tapanii]